ncbi:MAG TPA: hypothetical protein VN577_19700 [Terriglobales bacterium]|nr:hypothetical protein [Terriglobales bacterium]
MRAIGQSLAAAILVIAATVSAFSQPEKLTQIPPQWFEEPEKHAKKWKVKIEPILLFNQRFVIRSAAKFPASVKGAPRPEYHIFVRLADASGNWYPGHDYTRVDLAKVPPKAEMQWTTNIFVKPGTYRAVVLVYEEKSREHYLWRETIQIEKPRVLPDLDEQFPQVEFFDPKRRRATAGELLPIHTSRPLRIDLVFNLTSYRQLASRFDFFNWAVENQLIAATLVMSQLRPSQGCVRVSAIDILHRDVVRDRAPANTSADWFAVRESLRKNRDSDTIDVRTLTGRTQARKFFTDFLETVISDRSGCGAEQPDMDRAMVVVSDSLQFPPKTEREKIDVPNDQGVRFFYIRLSAPFTPSFFDQVGGMLSPLHPRRFEVRGAKDFRETLGKLILDLEQPAEKQE